MELRWGWLVGVFVCLVCLLGIVAANEDEKTIRLESKSSPMLVKVNGVGITEADLERTFVLRMIPVEMREGVREEILGQMIDTRLMREYLLKQKVTVSNDEVDGQIKRLEELLARRSDTKPVLDKMKENRKQLREEMAVPLMWRAWMRKTITDDQILEYFEKHREKLDGTKIRVSHILLKAPPGTSEAESERKATELKDLRGEIVSGKQSFEEAAKAKSEAPSGKEGGAIGTISWEGAMPDSFCEVAFQLPINEVSEPFRTHFGWHLCVVKEKIPGDLSVEDARREIIAKVSEEEWERKLTELRNSARIELIGK